MPSTAKKDVLASMKETLADIDFMWVVDYRGLTVKEVQELRNNIRETGASMKVYKNTLMHIAAEELSLPNMDEVLDGPSAFVFAAGDPVASAKALKEFAKGHDALEIKGGMMDNTFFDKAQVEAIADLPSREEMLAKLVGCLANPLTQTVRVLNAPMEAFARCVSAIAEQKPAA